MTSDYGSIWRKWDLHIHSPTSIFNNQFQGKDEGEKWDKYLETLESLSEISVIGVTDYWSIDGYKKLRDYKKLGRIPNIHLLIPNIELRILPATKSGNGINIHLLLNPEFADDFENQFFNSLEFEFDRNQYKCNREGLIKLGRDALHKPDMEALSAYEHGCNQFKTTVKDLNEILKKNSFLKRNCITAVANSSNDGNSGIQHSSFIATREEIYRFANVIFSSNSKDRDYFLGKGADSIELIRRKFGRPKPCIHGSDAHSLEKIGKPDEGRYTFIKSDLTFEGLRQIIYEPEYRVKISNIHPIDPPIRLVKLTLSFPNNSQIENERFCFSGNHTIFFNPNFTVFIGGRGTGKSMILNLIHERLKPGANKFFSNNKIKSLGQDVTITDVVSIDDDSDDKFVDYLSQNEIEEFAKESTKFTNAIYSRIKGRDIQGSIIELENRILDLFKGYNEAINAQIQLRDSHVYVEQLSKVHQTKKKIIESFKSIEYNEFTGQLKDVTFKLQTLEQSRDRFVVLTTELGALINRFKSQEFVFNEYDREYNALLKELSSIFDLQLAKTFSEQQAELSSMEGEKSQKQRALQDYLEGLGLAQENLRDISNANQETIAITNQIEAEKQKQVVWKNVMDSFSYAEYSNALEEYLSLLDNKISELNIVLGSISNQQVKKIRLELKLDSEKVSEKIFSEFKGCFSREIDAARNETKFDFQSLQQILLFEITQITRSQEAILNGISENSSKSMAKQFLFNLLSDKSNFEILKNIYLKNSIDHFNHKEIKVFYDGKEMEKTSFGQRCTAALVVLILLGNNPIIIDEPEAHLDSLLISDYIVDILKKTKANRQIIFATHNANFVINGDADLIHILKLHDDNTTTITNSTIENKETRADLLSLEGGQIAFETREDRYQLQN